MATFVQSKTVANKTSPCSLAWTSPVTAGNSAVACYAYPNASAVITSVADDNGNTYSKIKSTASGGHTAELWMSQGMVGGAATVTANFSSVESGIGICLIECAPTVGQIFSLDQQNAAASASLVTSFPAGSITTTENIEWIIYVGQMGRVTTISAPAGYTKRSGTGGANDIACVDRITTTTETTNCTPTGTNGSEYAALVVSLKEIADSSGLRFTQAARLVLSVQESSDVSINLTQMARYVLYPFACSSPPRPDTRVFITLRDRWGLERFDIKTRHEESS